MVYDNDELSKKTQDFTKRFLDFIERYNQFSNNNILEAAIIWVNSRNYEYILSFLKHDVKESFVPFSMIDFVKMNKLEICAWHDFCIELQHLFDEKQALYKELIELGL